MRNNQSPQCKVLVLDTSRAPHFLRNFPWVCLFMGLFPPITLREMVLTKPECSIGTRIGR
jgi:hypothetical protein